MQVPVGEHDEPAVLRAGVLPRLLFPHQRINLLRLGLQNDERKALGVQQQKVDEALGRLLEVLAESVEFMLIERDAQLNSNVGGLVCSWEETPTRPLQQLVNLYPCRSFVHALCKLIVNQPPS